MTLLKDVPSGTRLSDIGKRKIAPRELLATDSIRIRAGYLVQDLTGERSYEGRKQILRVRRNPDNVMRLVIDAFETDYADRVALLKHDIGYQEFDRIKALPMPDPNTGVDERPAPVVIDYDDVQQQAGVPDALKPDVLSFDEKFDHFWGQVKGCHADELGRIMMRDQTGPDMISKALKRARDEDTAQLPKFKIALGETNFVEQMRKIEEAE